MLEEIFSKDSDPTVTNPACSLDVHYTDRFNNTPVAMDNTLFYEAGGTISIEATPQFTPGQYQYGPETGVVKVSDTLEAVDAPLSNGKPDYGDTSTKRQTLEASKATSIKVPTDTNRVLQLNCLTTYKESLNTPLTLLGNTAPSLTIPGGQCSASKKIVPLYPIHYGQQGGDTLDDSVDFILQMPFGLLNPNQETTTFTINVNEGKKRILLCLPSAAIHNLEVKLRSSNNQPITEFFKTVWTRDNMPNRDRDTVLATEYTLLQFNPDLFQGNEVIDIIINNK